MPLRHYLENRSRDPSNYNRHLFVNEGILLQLRPNLLDGTPTLKNLLACMPISYDPSRCSPVRLQHFHNDDRVGVVNV